MICRFTAVCTSYGCNTVLSMAVVLGETVEEFRERIVATLEAQAWRCDQLGMLCPEHVTQAIGARL